MKVIKCEMCGSNDLLKQDGFYLCQSCGTKYSPEEAKKLLVEGVVQIDNSKKTSNLYTLARRARDNNNTEDAEKYYDEIRKEMPNDWEANFYAVFFKAYNCKIAEIYSAAKSVSNCIHSTFQLIDNSGLNPDARVNAFSLVSDSCINIAELLSSAEFDYYNGLDSSIRSNHSLEHDNKIHAIATIRFNLWDEFRFNYADDEILMKGVGLRILKYRIEHFYFNNEAKQTLAVIQKYEPDYSVDTSEQEELLVKAEKFKKEVDEFLENNRPDKPQQTGSCYVATCVYGSYDCPQVWTLRRYRDDTLAATWYGRTFVRIYYATSPTLVKWFGKTTWFKKMWQGKLDRLVKRLNDNGVENTPYHDRSW